MKMRAMLMLVCSLAAAPAWALTDSGEGEIRKVNAEERQVILRHGDWKGGNMAAMTMPIAVAPAINLNEVRRGDRVAFDVKKESGQWVVTRLQPITR
jgi:Cu/Ag efflux protein CusF